MGSDEENGRTELKEKILQGFRDFMTRVTKLEELGGVGIRLLSGFQQGLEVIQRPPINETSELIAAIVKANETKRFYSYIEAGCINSHDRIQNMSKLHRCLLGLEDHLRKAKNMINQLVHLLEDLAGAIQTANGCLSYATRDGELGDHPYQQASTGQEEISSCFGGVEMIDYASLMGIIFSMVKQDYVMQERIVTSLSFKTSSDELEGYCLMWSLRPFINDEIMQQAWRLIC